MLNILSAGCILNNRYEIRDLIYCDDKGTIYLVEDLNPPHEQLALKELIPSSKNEGEGHDEFWARLKSLTESAHPNLVKIYDYFSEVPEGNSDERHYIVMEYAKGRTMEDIFRTDLREQPVPIKMLLKQMVKICSALKYLNNLQPEPVSFGILSPKYIILTPERQIKLFNYGIGNLFRAGTCAITPGFAPSEEIFKKRLNEKTDVFSLGATIHYLLTGKDPQKNPMKFEAPINYNKEVTRELNNLLLKCVSPKEDERPTFQEISNFLLKSYMEKSERPKSIILQVSQAVVKRNEEGGDEERTIEFIPQIEESFANIEDPPQAQSTGSVDIFTYSDEKPVPPGKSKSPEADHSADYRDKFQNVAKRGTRRFDMKHYAAAQQVLEAKGVKVDKIEEKARESIEKSANLLKLASTRKLHIPSGGIKLPEKISEEIKAEKHVKPVENKGSQEKESEHVKISQEEFSLAKKLAQKYARKKQEEKEGQGEPGGEEKEEKEEKIKRPFIKTAGLPSNWMEQKEQFCKQKPDTPPILEPLKEGAIVKDRYEIAELLQKDCHGAVYMAFDMEEQESEKAVRAIKELQFKPPSDNYKLGEKIIANFVRLGNKLKKIEHQNLIKIKDYFFSYSGDRSTIRLFLVMEFVEGYSLEQIIKTHQQKNTKIPSPTIFSMITKISDALEYLHSRTPVDAVLDLNPSNVILSYGGEVKIINYGLREIFVVNNNLIYPYYGHMGYFAPEQSECDTNNTKVDIFALGSIAYYLLSGINPQDKPYEFIPLRKANPYISPNVEELIEKCIKLDPNERANIKTLKEKISKITMVELDSTLLEKQKEIQDKRKASMEEIGDITPLSKVLGKVALIYVLPLIAFLLIALGIYKGVDYIISRPMPGPKLYLSVNSQKILKEFDLKTNRFTKDVKLKFGGTLMVSSPLKKKLYIADKSDVYIVNTEEGKKGVIGKLETKINITYMLTSNDGTSLYIISNKTNRLKGIDMVTNTFTGEANLPENPISADISADGKKLYIINNSEENFLTILDSKTFSVIKQYPIDKFSIDVSIAKTTDMAFISFRDDFVYALNLSSGAGKKVMTNTDDKKTQPSGLAVINNELYVANQLVKEVMILKVPDLAVISRIQLDGYPTKIVVSNNNIYIYTIEVVGIKRHYTISILDCNTKSIICKIPLEGSVDDIAVGAD